MSLFNRHRLPAEVRRSLGDHLGRAPQVMGWGSGPRVVMVALPELFCWRFEGQRWQQLEWRQVRTGGWKYEESTMWWRTTDGGSEQIQLDEEADFPAVFRDRVQASIAVERRVELGRGRAVLVTARRGLGSAETNLAWDVVGLSGAKLDDPSVASVVESTVASLEDEYGF